MNEALEYAAQKGETVHEKILAVDLAKMINLFSGGAVIAPWEVDQLDDEWVAVFRGLASLTSRRASYQAFEKRLIERRAQHPTYRKYLN